MRIGRNDLCPCGSGKKYKRCCMNSSSKQIAQMQDEIEQSIAMNPNLTLEDLNVVAQHKMAQVNNQSIADFCGMSSNQMANWMYAPFNELADVTLNTPEDLTGSPVMRYLALILDEAMDNGGSFKATAKGNLPAKLVKQASDLLPEFALYQNSTPISRYDHEGSNEDKFNALHYTRILAEVAGIIYRRSGHFHVKKAAQKQYQNFGINAFFLPMLEAVVQEYNWGYLDAIEDDVDVRQFWLFMLWRVQCHGSFERLIDEVSIAFPALLHECAADEYHTPMRQLSFIIETRFIKRFLQYWGFVTYEPSRIFAQDKGPAKLQIQPLLRQTFQFTI